MWITRLARSLMLDSSYEPTGGNLADALGMLQQAEQGPGRCRTIAPLDRGRLFTAIRLSSWRNNSCLMSATPRSVTAL
jgi:hypothetical protein